MLLSKQVLVFLFTLKLTSIIIKGITEHRASYDPKQVEASKSYKPDQFYRPSSAALDDLTTYKYGYVPKNG